MRRTIIAVMLVGALLAGGPNAVAIGDTSALAPALDVLPETGLDVATVLGDPLAPVEQVTANPLVEAALNTVHEALECRAAVRIDLTWWGGIDTASERKGLNFILPQAISAGTQRIEAPIYETVTKVVWEPTGALRTVQQIPLLGGLLSQVLEPVLEPVTKTTTTLVEVREVLQPVFQRADFAVTVDWFETRVEWTGHREVHYLTLPAGSAALASGDGTLVQICDPDTVLLTATPWPDASGYDRFSVFRQPAIAWYTEILSLDVRLAQEEDYESLEVRSWGLDAPPSAVVSAVTRGCDGVSVSDADFDEQNTARAAHTGDTASDTGLPGDDASTHGTGAGTQVQVPTATGMILATLAASALALVGAAGRFVWLRRP